MVFMTIWSRCVCLGFLCLTLPLFAKVECLIFDCDGTLVDTERLKYEAWRQTLASRGFHLGQDHYKSLIGQSGEKILSDFHKTLRVPYNLAIIDEKNQRYSSLHKEGVMPIEANLKALFWVDSMRHQRGLKLAIASSANKAEILRNVKALGLDKTFDVILSGKDDLKEYRDADGVNKPKPYIYLKAAKKMGVPTSACLVIEDSNAGICSAKNAGCHVIAVLSEWTKEHDSSLADTTLFSPTAEELIAAIQKFL